MLVDSHCHLNMIAEKGLPDEEAVKNASDAGVTTLLTICTKMAEFEEVHTIAQQYDNVMCSVGIHPHEAANEEAAVEELVEKSKSPKVIGLGEVGLDYYYENSPREDQQRGFLTHIEAARQTSLPVIIHTREADDDTINILTDEKKKGDFKALIHCFGSDEYLADACIELGCYISFSGIATFKNAEGVRRGALRVPMDRMLVETDAPFLAPVPHRGKLCEPAYTRHTAEFMAAFKEMDFEAFAKQTTDNFFELFSKAKRHG